ncbi:hypothetical protein EIP86_000773 [Pleurotus ostreatoroseus]|nr:hypothetical protein EIP86_000773 [Pleurotus ostreatoroseus]
MSSAHRPGSTRGPRTATDPVGPPRGSRTRPADSPAPRRLSPPPRRSPPRSMSPARATAPYATPAPHLRWLVGDVWGLMHEGASCEQCQLTALHHIAHRGQPEYDAAVAQLRADRADELRAAADARDAVWRADCERAQARIAQLERELGESQAIAASLQASLQEVQRGRSRSRSRPRRVLSPSRSPVRRPPSRSQSPYPRPRSWSRSRSRSRSRAAPRRWSRRSRSRSPRRGVRSRSRSLSRRRSPPRSPLPRSPAPSRWRASGVPAPVAAPAIPLSDRIAATVAPIPLAARLSASAADPIVAGAPPPVVDDDPYHAPGMDEDDDDDDPAPSAPGPPPILERYDSGIPIDVMIEWNAARTSAKIPARKGHYVFAHEQVLDARYPLPPTMPSTRDINPLTGRRWTGLDLKHWPCGYYGLPACGRRGVIDARQEAPQYGTPSNPRGRVEGGEDGQPPIPPPALRIDWPDYDSDGSVSELQPWWDRHRKHYRLPDTDDEIKALQRIRETPGNWIAAALIIRFVSIANNTPSEQLSPQQRLLLGAHPERPSWYPTAPRPLNRHQVAARVQLGAAPPAPAPTTPMPVDEDVPMTDAPAVAPHGHIISPTTDNRVRNPTVDELEQLQDWLSRTTDYVPGIVRGADGRAVDDEVLEGLYRIAQTGPRLGRMSDILSYLCTAAEVLARNPDIEPPGQSAYNMHFSGDASNSNQVSYHLRTLANRAFSEFIGTNGDYAAARTWQAVKAWVSLACPARFDRR